MKLKIYLTSLICLLFFYGCKKYNCECITIQHNPPKGDTWGTSHSSLYGPESRAKKNCNKLSDPSMEKTCTLK